MTAGAHSFNLLENDAVEKTIRKEAMVKFNQFLGTVEQVLDKSVRSHCVTATCDKWSDDCINASTWIFQSSGSTSIIKLSRSLLRCKRFFRDRKAGMNTCPEIKHVFESFGLSSGDTTIVTDHGDNIKHHPINPYPVYCSPMQHDA